MISSNKLQESYRKDTGQPFPSFLSSKSLVDLRETKQQSKKRKKKKVES
jgi:hypothetical protein